jgi:phosphate transport system substrate-binding protein
VEFNFTQRLGLKVASLEKKKRRIGLPIVAYTWALIRKKYQKPSIGTEIRDFIKWTLNEGQSLAAPLHYLPLSPEMIRAEQDKLRLYAFTPLSLWLCTL